MKIIHFILQECCALVDEIGPPNQFFKLVLVEPLVQLELKVDCVSRKMQQIF